MESLKSECTMADDVWTELHKNSKISVTVEEVLADIIVVSFSFQGRLFQGVLLDSTKKLLPCGIVAPPHEVPPLGTASTPLEDKLFSASQRYSYYQEKTPQNVDRLQLKRNIRPPARFRNARMTVRLRPRQVLCSKCRGICNENSENVDLSSKKRKETEKSSSPGPKVTRPERRLRSSGEISPRPVFPDNPRAQPKKNSHSEVPGSKRRKMCAPLVPKLSPLPKQEMENGRVQKIKIVGNYWVPDGEETRNEEASESLPVEADERSEKCDFVEEDPLSIPELDTRLEKPLDEGQFEMKNCEDVGVDDDTIDRCSIQEDKDPLDLAPNNPQRVLRKKRSVGSMEDLWDETVFEDPSKMAEKKGLANKTKTPVIKISFGSGTGEGTVVKIPAKPQNIPSESDAEEKIRDKTTRDASAKAAKKALKRAKKEARRKIMGTSSPARSLGGASPRYPNLSPRYIGTISPRQPLGNASPAYEILHKKHKHKLKHKKRHKEEKKHKEPEADGDVEVKEDSICLKQKLSISLKRLNANAYMRCESSSPSNSDASDEHSDAVPDFPGTPLMMRISTQAITSCQTSDGRLMAVGDVVWGKIHGFPWWPGKVLSITVSRKEDGACSSPQAHVAWYGSSTSSLMSCDQLNPFLETFQMRYNKKKRGPYKEAIKQATTEAKRGDVGLSPDVYSSPTEVDVAS